MSVSRPKARTSSILKATGAADSEETRTDESATVAAGTYTNLSLQDGQSVTS